MLTINKEYILRFLLVLKPKQSLEMSNGQGGYLRLVIAFTQGHVQYLAFHVYKRMHQVSNQWGLLHAFMGRKEPYALWCHLLLPSDYKCSCCIWWETKNWILDGLHIISITASLTAENSFQERTSVSFAFEMYIIYIFYLQIADDDDIIIIVNI